MKSFFSFVFIFFLIGSPLLWASELPSSDCDTIFMKDGSVHLATIIRASNTEVEFSVCESGTADRFVLPADKVARVAFYKKISNKAKDAYKEDPIGRMAHNALIITVLGTVIVALLSFWGIPGYILIIIGLIKAERALRMIKPLKDYAFEKKAKKEAKASIKLGVIMIIFPIFLYLLSSLIL